MAREKLSFSRLPDFGVAYAGSADLEPGSIFVDGRTSNRHLLFAVHPLPAFVALLGLDRQSCNRPRF